MPNGSWTNPAFGRPATVRAGMVTFAPAASSSFIFASTFRDRDADVIDRASGAWQWVVDFGKRKDRPADHDAVRHRAELRRKVSFACRRRLRPDRSRRSACDRTGTFLREARLRRRMRQSSNVEANTCGRIQSSLWWLIVTQPCPAPASECIRRPPAPSPSARRPTLTRSRCTMLTCGGRGHRLDGCGSHWPLRWRWDWPS